MTWRVSFFSLLFFSVELLLPALPLDAQSLEDRIWKLMGRVNQRLEADGLHYRLEVAEYLVLRDSNELGRTVFFSDRGNKQIPDHFVPGDPRRGGQTNIAYAVDAFDGAVDGLSAEETTGAIDRAMGTWSQVKCSSIPIAKLADVPFDFGVVEFMLGGLALGSIPIPVADIAHTGWLPPGFLEPEVLSVTFTFVFVDAAPPFVPTDIDNNKRPDTAFREILYNASDGFPAWTIDGNIDVETVALHEAGHGLSQAHFGGAFGTNRNGKIHFNPRAVMNGGYSGVQQKLTGTDNGGHCSIWASWPKK